MKRVLNCTAKDFCTPTSHLEIKDAIRETNGRTLLCEIDSEWSPLFNEVTNAEICSAFGADMVMLKRVNPDTCEFCGTKYENIVQAFHKLAGIGVGVNMNTHSAWAENVGPTEAAIEKFASMDPDFLSITGYHMPGITHEEIMKDLKLMRSMYDGMINLHHVRAISDELDLDEYLAYVDAGADMITMPVPGTVQGITVERLQPIIDAVHAAGAIVSLTTFTSQEGSDPQTIRDMTIQARMAGADVFAFGDANICGVPEPEDIMAASIAMRGKRHTYVRMARSAIR